jgi:hypothetical protein
MPYLIDGHNLIPFVPGLSLSALDDELGLVGWLQEFCRQKRTAVEVYFDRAPHGYPVTRKFGAVTAVFVPQGMIADEAIRQRLRRLGKDARNWVVVSGDRQVQAEARAARARVIPSAEFAAQLTLPRARKSPAPRGESLLSEAELEEWMRLFGDNDKSSGKSDKLE